MTLTGKTASGMMIVSAGSGATVSGLTWMESIGVNAQAYGIIITVFVAVTGVLIKVWQLREEKRHNLEIEKQAKNPKPE